MELQSEAREGGNAEGNPEALAESVGIGTESERKRWLAIPRARSVRIIQDFV